MEHLFTTDLIASGKPTLYYIDFENESYSFKPEDGNAPAFHLKRDHDEWHCTGKIDEVLKAQAIKSLDDYLFKQH